MPRTVVLTGDESDISILLLDLEYASYDSGSAHSWRVVDAGNPACVELSLDREEEE